MKRWLTWVWLAWLSMFALFLTACANGSEETSLDVDAGGITFDTGATDAPGEGGAVGEFVVGGTVVGLLGKGLVLQNAGGDDLPIAADGTFSFPAKLASGASYDVTIKTQPSDPSQNCSVTGGKGVIGTANVTGVIVNCSTDSFTIGGTVSGLAGKGLLLSLNGTENLPITSNGTFAFPTLLKSGAAYKVTVGTEPNAPSQKCTASANEGVVGSAAVTSVKIECETRALTVGGVVSGLEGGSVVLQNNGGDDLTVAANGAFTFSKPVLSGTTYAVTLKTQPIGPSQTCVVAAGTGTVGEADVKTVTVTCTTNTYKIRGTVVGLTGSGLVLQKNGTEDLAISKDGAFVFAGEVKSGGAFGVAIKTQPSAPSQTCTVAGGTGVVASSDVTSVIVNCANDRYTVGGTVVGLTGSGLVLQNNGGDDLAIGANGGFAFATPLSTAAFYSVSIKTQPASPAQTCVVVGGAGTIGAGPVSSVVINCSSTLVVVGGSVNGLKGSGLVLQNNGGDDLKISGTGTFAFPTGIAGGAAYAVTVKAQPSTPTQTCTITGGSGTAPAAPGSVTSVVINCVTQSFTIGGTVSGLTGTGLVLQNNAGDDLAVTSNGTFTFPTKLLSGAAYTVTVKSQPTAPSQSCTITSGSGTVGGSAVTGVTVACKVDTFTVGGTVTGLKGAGLVLQNNLGDDLTIGSDGAFTFATPVKSGNPYSVTVKSQPTTPSQSCTVTAKSGTVAGANVTSVVVTCVTSTFTVGGTVSGLLGTGLVLQNNLGDDLTITANDTFTFPTKLASGDSYKVTVKTQPSGPTQTCAITGGTGNVGGGPVTGVVVNCATDAFTVGGTVTGLDGSGLRLLLNGASPLEITGNGSFAFSGAISSGTAFAVTVDSQPTSKSQTCTVTGGTGTVASANVTSVVVNCTTNALTVAVNVTGLAGSGLVVKNNAETVAVTGNGETPFPTKVLSGSTYNVSVSTQPTSPSQTCTVTGGFGTVANTKVVVNVACVTNSFTVGGTITGLATDATLVLRNQAGTDLTFIGTGAAIPFTFSTSVASGTTYSVVVQTRPVSPISQTCTVTSGSGTMGAANVTTVAVTCTTNKFTVSARVIGMTGGTLVLQNKGADDLTFVGNGTLPFATKLASGVSYAVTVKTQPATQVCNVSLGVGVIGDADVTVTVNCSTTYTVGGTVSGLSGTVTLVNSGGDDLVVSANGNFNFPTPLTTGTTYNVTVKTQPGSPKWQTCTVANGSGTIGSVNVTNVAVTCTTNTYFVGGTVTGLGTGTLVLQNNSGDNLTLTSGTLTSGGGFKFATKIASGSPYLVKVLTQPSTPGLGQTCTVTAGSGTVTNADITSVAINCVNNYSVGGTITGLKGDGLVLALTAGGVTGYSTVTASTPATSFTFPNAVPSGTTWSVAVQTQPTKYYQTCTVTSGSGTMGSANVTTVGVTCGAVSKIVITQSAFTVGGVAQSSPASIPDSATTCSTGTAGAALNSEIVLASHFTVGNVTVSLNNIQHTWVGDLKARVELETTAVIASTSLFDRVGRYTTSTGCGSSAKLTGTYGFDDSAATSLWTSTAVGTYHPVGPRTSSTVDGFTFLEAAPAAGFSGADTAGKWRLVITDSANGDVGTITSWTLTLTP